MEEYSKNELLELNQKVWGGQRGLFPVASSLDSSMKKNTAFIKRIRAGITASALSTILQDIQTLSLHKYLSELISACYEGICKLKNPADINAGVRVVSALHHRFGVEEFTKYLAWYITRGLAVPTKSASKSVAQDIQEREEKERIGRQRYLLRVATELWLLGVIRTGEDVGRPEDASKDSMLTETPKGKNSVSPISKPTNADQEPIPLRALKDLVANDKYNAHLPLVVTVVKAFSNILFGAEDEKIIRDEDGATTEEAGLDPEASSSERLLVDPELQAKFKRVLVRYFEILTDRLVRDKESLDALSRRNAEAYVKSGEIFEDRQSNFEKQSKALEKLTTNVQVLAKVLDLEMPDLKTKEIAPPAEGIVGMVKSSDYAQMQSAAAGIWEDEDERRFYENIPDLKERVPSSLLEVRKKKADTAEVRLKRTDSKTNTSTVPDAAPGATQVGSVDIDPVEAEELSSLLVNKTVVAQLDSILARLPEVSTKEAIDEIAHEFCYVNSKASRNRIMKVLQDIPKGRTDLLPLYSRLIAILGQYMPDISQGMVDYLDDEFRSLQRRKQREFLGQVRLMNVKYLAELTKFGVVPEHVIFHCLKVTIDDFSRMNIEIMCTLLENCGRYLYRTTETHERMVSALETVQRKKTVQNLGQQERVLIENACYYVNPPERQAIVPKERTPIELFVRKLMYSDLKRSSLERIVKLLRKLHWDQPDTLKMMLKIFSKPQKLPYNNIHLMAAMLGFLSRYHSEFTVFVIDSLLESIHFGLELNDYQFNQRRLSEVKYLGELYVYKLVDNSVIFSTLYLIVTYGHPGGTPTLGRLCMLDLPDDFFRIRLVCNLLETCGTVLAKGTARKKLDFFLTFFQYYIYTKEPLPMDIEFVVQDMYNRVRPRWKLVSTLAEAASLFAEAVRANYKIPEPGAVVPTADVDEDEESRSNNEAEDDERDGDDENDDDHDDDKWFDKELKNVTETGAQDDDDDSSADENHDSLSNGEQFRDRKVGYERDPEVEADFDREFAKMMAESNEPRKVERKAVFAAPLPVRIAPAAAPVASPDGVNGTDSPPSRPPAGLMKFSVLTKRGNKPQTRTIDLPSESSFAQAISTSKQAEEAERQRIKQLVLTYNQTSATESDADSIPYPPNSLPRLDKASKSRSGQRSRKLQLEDVMW